MNHNAHLAEVVLCFSGPAGDPGRVAQTQLPLDHQGVGWVLAATVCVVVLQGLEVTAGMEGVGAGEELGTWPNFTSDHSGVKWLKWRGSFVISYSEQINPPAIITAVLRSFRAHQRQVICWSKSQVLVGNKKYF